jgi:hypothetical protein
MDRLEAKEVHEQVDQAPSSKLQALSSNYRIVRVIFLPFPSLPFFPSASKLDSNLLWNSARARQRKVVR